ncbi:hypothetical protein FACS189431_4750 [Alphaproteobacteria bacterium]|nr:hypothetical protein FACS189431_4750 [Alphaproteobacteria bacterium]
MDPMLRPVRKVEEPERAFVDGPHRDETPVEAVEMDRPARAEEATKRPRINLKKPSKRTIKFILIGVAIAVVLAVVAAIVYTVTAPVSVGKIETLQSLSSRTEDAPVQSEFAVSEPIMLHFEYGGAKTGLSVAFEVKNQSGEVVKSGTTTVLRPTDDEKADGQRYVSVVNTPSTALPAGRYEVILTAEGRVVKTIGFRIVEQ